MFCYDIIKQQSFFSTYLLLHNEIFLSMANTISQILRTKNPGRVLWTFLTFISRCLKLQPLWGWPKSGSCVPRRLSTQMFGDQCWESVKSCLGPRVGPPACSLHLQNREKVLRVSNPTEVGGSCTIFCVSALEVPWHHFWHVSDSKFGNIDTWFRMEGYLDSLLKKTHALLSPHWRMLCAKVSTLTI